MKLAEAFECGASQALQAQLREWSSLSYLEACALPEVGCRDIVIVGREAQLNLYRQTDRPAAGQVLLTAQIVRYTMGGGTSLRFEKGAVFAADRPVREATGPELEASLRR